MFSLQEGETDMKLKVEHLPNIAVITVTGRLVAEESEKLVTNVKQVLEEGTRQLIIDLSESRNMDSSGIGSLLQAYIEVKNQSGRLGVVMPNDFFVRHRIIHPIPICELYRSREEAIDALLDLSIAPDRIESEARRMCEDIESRRRKASGCLIFACVVFLLGAAMLIAAWLK